MPVRRRELGIRAALGASPSALVFVVARHGLALTLAGAAIGLAAAPLLGRLLGGMLYGVTPADPLTMIAMACTLAAVSLAASVIPARRAAHVDPASALRSE